MSFLFIICLFLSASDRWIGADSGSKLLTNLLLPSSNNAKFSTSRNCEFSFLISDITKLDYCFFCWLIRLAFLLIIKFLKPIITSPFILLCCGGCQRWWLCLMKLMLSKTMWGSLSPYRGWKKWKSATFAEEKTSKYSSSPTRGDPNPKNCVFAHCSEFSMYAWGRKKSCYEGVCTCKGKTNIV